MMLWPLMWLACRGDEVPAPPRPPSPVDEEVCDAGDAMFVERAIELVQRRRPRGTAEVAAWVQALRDHDRADVVAAMASSPALVDGWSDTVLDLLLVDRVGDQGHQACFGAPLRPTADGRLAAHLRAHGPEVPFGEAFNGADVVRDALAADDLSLAYRVWLLAQMSRRLPPCDAQTDELNEAQARRDIGVAFFDAYLHRPVDCMGCHNSAFAVTDHSDPELDHHWPMEGRFEAALLGTDAGPQQPDEAYAVFRVRDVTEGADRFRPWGWDPACGELSNLEGVTEDMIERHTSVFIDELGPSASAFTVERYLAQGVDDLAAGGLAPWSDGTVAGPEAFAYLVAANIGDQVFADVAGARLTLANGFPRTEAQRDRLQTLADTMAQRFSLVDLLQAVAADPVFNAGSPAACDDAPYGLPPLVAPWSEEEEDPVRRGNGPGDLVHRRAPRVLLRSVYDLLEWPLPSDFAPVDDVEALFTGVGAYRRDEVPGYRTVDMTSLLTLEGALQRCTVPAGEAPRPDAIDRLVAAASGHTVEQAVVALKDRLLLEPRLDETEAPLVEAVVGLSLASEITDPVALDEGLRALCSVWITSAPFQLRTDHDAGLPPPAFDPLGQGACAEVAERMAAIGADVRCEP